MKDAVIGGVVVTAKHHDGSRCNWPTALSCHSVRSRASGEGPNGRRQQYGFPGDRRDWRTLAEGTTIGRRPRRRRPD